MFRGRNITSRLSDYGTPARGVLGGGRAAGGRWHGKSASSACMCSHIGMCIVRLDVAIGEASPSGGRLVVGTKCPGPRDGWPVVGCGLRVVVGEVVVGFEKSEVELRVGRIWYVVRFWRAFRLVWRWVWDVCVLLCVWSLLG